MAYSESVFSRSRLPRPGSKWILSAFASPTARMVDRIEQAVLLALNAFLWWRLMPSDFHSQHWFIWLLLLSEGTILFFILIRRSTDRITTRPLDWVMAFVGSFTALLVTNNGSPFLPEVAFGLMLIGFVIHFAAKMTLRRSFGVVPADRGLKTDGIYSIVRHPMYFGYLLTHISFLLAAPAAWNLILYIIVWSCMVYRMRAEERVLSQNPEYRDYMSKVRFRLVPFVW